MCSGLQRPVFRIPRAKVSLNRESGLPYMERSKQELSEGYSDLRSNLEAKERVVTQ